MLDTKPELSTGKSVVWGKMNHLPSPPPKKVLLILLKTLTDPSFYFLDLWSHVMLFWRVAVLTCPLPSPWLFRRTGPWSVSLPSLCCARQNSSQQRWTTTERSFSTWGSSDTMWCGPQSLLGRCRRYKTLSFVFSSVFALGSVWLAFEKRNIPSGHPK